MKIELFTLFIGKYEEDLIPIRISINGKLATYCEAYFSEEDSWDVIYEIKEFSYEFDNTFYKEYKFKPNIKFVIFPVCEDDDDHITNTTAFAHLSYIKRLRLDWTFRKCWIQNSENLKWLISIPMSIITALITTYLTLKYLGK